MLIPYPSQENILIGDHNTEATHNEEREKVKNENAKIVNIEKLIGHA